MSRYKLNMPSDIIDKVPKTKVSKQDAIAEYLKSLEQSKKNKDEKDFQFTPVTKSFTESLCDVVDVVRNRRGGSEDISRTV